MHMYILCVYEITMNHIYREKERKRDWTWWIKVVDPFPTIEEDDITSIA